MNKILAKHKANAVQVPNEEDEREKERVKSVVDWNDRRFYNISHHVIPEPSVLSQQLVGSNRFNLSSFMSLNLMPGTTSESVEVKDDQHPLRCTNCFAYVNPWFVFKDNGKRFTCNICRQVSEVPETCYSPLDDRNLPIDFEKRPELSYPVYEFNVSSDYNAYPMRGEWKVFVIHASGAFLESAMTCVAEWLRNRRAALLAKREIIRIMIAKQRKYRRSHIQKEHPTWEPEEVDEADKLEERNQIEALMPRNLFSIVFLGSTTDFVTIPTGLDPKSDNSTSELASFTIQGLNDHQNFGLSKQYHDVSGVPFLWNQFMIPVEKVSDLFLDRLVDLSSYKGWGTSDTLDHLDNVIAKSLIHIGKFGREKMNYPHVFLIMRIDPRMKHHYSIQLSPSAQQRLSQPDEKDASLGEKFTQMLGIKSASATTEGQQHESFQLKLSQALNHVLESICTLDVFVLPPTSQGQDSLSADEVNMLSKLADYRTRIEYQTSGRTHIYQSESAFEIDNFQQELLGVLLTKEEGPRSAEFANATLVGRASFEVDLKVKIPYECEYNDELNIEYCHYYDE